MFKGVVTDVFFDLDHTLWDFEKNSGLTFRKILTENKIEVALEDFLHVYEPINFEYWKLYRENRISQDDLRYFRLKKSFDSLNVLVADDMIAQLSVQYIEYLSSFPHLVPDAREVLEYLKPNYRLHIITNGFQQVQARKLLNANIHDFFELVIDSEMAGVKKPNPYIFELALQKAGVSPQKALMIGDSLEADIHGARAAGFHTLHFNAAGDDRSNIGLMVTSLGEIKSYL